MAERVWRPAAEVATAASEARCRRPAVTAGAARLARRDPVLPDGTRGLPGPKIATVERREASAPIARCAPRLTARLNNMEQAPVGAPPPLGSGVADEGRKVRDPGRDVRGAAGTESCGSMRVPGGGFCPAHERWLFDSVNRGSTASRRFASRAPMSRVWMQQLGYRAGVATCPGRSAARSDVLQTRDRTAHRRWNGPGSAVHRCALTRSTLHRVRDTRGAISNAAG